MPEEGTKTGNGEQDAARFLKAYFQLMADLAGASGAGFQVFADQLSADNVFRLDAKNGFIQAASDSFNKTGDLIPKAYSRYWKSL